MNDTEKKLRELALHYSKCIGSTNDHYALFCEAFKPVFALVRSEVLEEAAKVCDEIAESGKGQGSDSFIIAAEECAFTIRALKRTGEG